MDAFLAIDFLPYPLAGFLTFSSCPSIRSKLKRVSKRWTRAFAYVKRGKKRPTRVM